MLQITATEFKTNFGKYLALLSKETIIITKNNKPIAKITNAIDDKVSMVQSIFGSVPDKGYTLEDAIRDRLSRQWKFLLILMLF